MSLLWSRVDFFWRRRRCPRANCRRSRCITRSVNRMTETDKVADSFESHCSCFVQRTTTKFAHTHSSRHLATFLSIQSLSLCYLVGCFSNEKKQNSKHTKMVAAAAKANDDAGCRINGRRRHHHRWRTFCVIKTSRSRKWWCLVFFYRMCCIWSIGECRCVCVSAWKTLQSAHLHALTLVCWSSIRPFIGGRLDKTW